jgi:hypothetical protein
MSERSLRALLDRITNDRGFADQLRDDSVTALAEFDLSAVELFALTCGDEDALRRLADSTAEYSSVESSVFRDAMLPAFDREAAKAVGKDGAAGGKTTKVTSQGVTVCCWP